MTMNVLYIDKVEEKHINYNDFYGHAPAQEPLPRGHEIYNFSQSD